MSDASSIVDRWGGMVQATGAEISVTLMVHGTVVSGLLTAPSRYYDWQERSVAICREMGNGGQENSALPATDAEVRQIRARWEEEHGGTEPGDFRPTELCVRNASVASPAGAFTFAYLLIDPSRVDAFTLGSASMSGIAPP